MLTIFVKKDGATVNLGENSPIKASLSYLNGMAHTLDKLNSVNNYIINSINSLYCVKQAQLS